MRKILFLDFDGVMVTDRYQDQLVASDNPIRDDYGAIFDPACVEYLQEIIDATDAEIVVTSTWKMNLGLDGIQQMWEARNLPGKVTGVTPDIDPIHRGNEIAAWLATNPGAVGDILYPLSSLDFLDDIKNTVKLLAGQFVNGLFKAL